MKRAQRDQKFRILERYDDRLYTLAEVCEELQQYFPSSAQDVERVQVTLYQIRLYTPARVKKTSQDGGKAERKIKETAFYVMEVEE